MDSSSRPASHSLSALPPENLLSAIIDSSDDAIVSKDLNGIITSWNKGAEKIFGYRPDEVVGHSILIILPDDRKPEEADILARIRRGERIDHFETVRRRKDGSLIDVSVTISPIRGPDGVVLGASKIARDITEQKRGNASGLLLAAIVNSSDDAILSKNLDGIITSWNRGAQRIFGYTAEEIVGKSVLTLLPVTLHDEERTILARLQRGERIERFESIRVRKNGEHFDVSLTISPIRDLQGRVIGASKIARDITDVKRTLLEREQLLESERVARAQAEHANRMKDDFLATVSHELRTPLNAIVGWTEVLRSDASTAADVAEGVEVIKRNALVQAQIIDDLLDLGRIASGKMILNVEPVDVTGIVRESIASVQHAADQKRIAIRNEVETCKGRLMADAKRLQQVVWNLLTNAIKFTPNDGTVSLRVACIGAEVEISVADTGRGIDPKFLPHVFERFRQADSSTTRQHGGLGIGLALVKQLTELHGGSVQAASGGPGKGATFTVRLPMTMPSEHHPRASALPAPVPGVAGQADLSGIKVLAVDDDRDSLEVIRRILVGRNAVVQPAASAEQGIQFFQSFEPHVILSDIGMPGQDGYDFIRRVRELPNGAWVPAAALTALARADDRMRALQAGFQTHLAKPVAAAEVVAVVRSLASLNNHRDQARN